MLGAELSSQGTLAVFPHHDGWEDADWHLVQRDQGAAGLPAMHKAAPTKGTVRPSLSAVD